MLAWARPSQAFPTGCLGVVDMRTMGSCHVAWSVRRQVCSPKRPIRPPASVHRERPLSWLPTSSRLRPHKLCALAMRCSCARHQAACSYSRSQVHRAQFGVTQVSR